MQIAQCRRGSPWVAEFHARVCGRVQHSRRRHRDYASAYINMFDAASTALLAVSEPDDMAIQRVLALPDMGRMTGEWRLGVAAACSQAPCGEANRGRHHEPDPISPMPPTA